MQVRRLTLHRFRRFEHLEWHPRPGINCLIGPGDAGKTTLLDAIGLALSPAPSFPASEHDFFERRTEAGFEIDLVLGNLPESVLATFHLPALWGWRGEGQEMLMAPLGDEAEPVMRLVVRGTADLEIEHYCLLPNGEEVRFSADRRRSLGLCRVGTMRGSSREFRMTRGSLLERTIGRDEVRGNAARAVRAASSEFELPDEIDARLQTLATRFQQEGIAPNEVTLELLPPAGQNLLGLLGLALGEKGRAIALSYSGEGAQRMASFVLATGRDEMDKVIVLDEAEYGLEPYRRRMLVKRIRELVGTGGQAFITTHSPTVLAELAMVEVFRVHIRAGDTETAVTALSDSLETVASDEPEVLVSRLPIVAEGTTELALMSRLLPGFAAADGLDLEAVGAVLFSGGGQPRVFTQIRALREAHFPVAAFLDDEDSHRGSREALSNDHQVAYSCFSTGSCTEASLAAQLTMDQLDELLEVTASPNARVGEGRRQCLNEKLDKPGRSTPTELAARFGEDRVREAVGHAAHKQGWFKSRSEALALADWIADGRLPEQMRLDLEGFYVEIRTLLGVSGEKEVRLDAGRTGANG